MPDSPASTSSTLNTIRRLLAFLVLFGLIGTTAELWLMGHYEDVWQWTPLVVMVAAAVAAGWLVATWSPAAARTFRVGMVLLMLSGAVGTVLHYRGNMEFQLEMNPSLGGVALMSKVLHAKAPPALAPGNMVLLGLVGLVSVWRLHSSFVPRSIA